MSEYGFFSHLVDIAIYVIMPAVALASASLVLLSPFIRNWVGDEARERKLR
jgi:hypothetical protein